MDMTRWLAHLDSHIAAGQVAAEAESTELLSWLLKLEPEQRWCLLLSRDDRLRRLSAGDYRRLLSLMVEHESQALAGAPHPPQPCLESQSSLPVPAPLTQERGVRYPKALLILAALLALGAAGGLWLSGEDGRQWGARVHHEVAAWLQSVSGGQDRPAVADARLSREALTTERLQRLMTARSALETLERKLTTGDPFSTELAALERVWPVPEQLQPLRALADAGTASPDQLISRLAQLQQKLPARRAELLQEARLGRLGRDRYYAQMQSIAALETQGDKALEAAREHDWRLALQAGDALEDPDFQAWAAQVSGWLDIRALVDDLSRQLWTQWLEGLPQSIEAETR